jgi:hypothetical protein
MSEKRSRSKLVLSGAVTAGLLGIVLIAGVVLLTPKASVNAPPLPPTCCGDGTGGGAPSPSWSVAGGAGGASATPSLPTAGGAGGYAGTSASGGGDLAERLQAARERLSEGRIAFPVEMQMRLGDESSVVVRLSTTTNVDAQGIPGTRVETAPIKLTPIMVACLQGAPGVFRIRGDSGDSAPSKPADSEHFACRQKAVAGTNTEWAWSVTPLESGPQTLDLTVEARFIESSADRGFPGPTFPALRRTIHVESNWMYTGERFLSEYWQWMLGVIVIPAGLWLGPRLRELFRKQRSAGFNRN